jgi:ribosome-binding protein aMBF1 (putative translation factor)
MDCESCGRHWPSDHVVPTRSITGEVVMVCTRCRRHIKGRTIATHGSRLSSARARPATTAA